MGKNSHNEENNCVFLIDKMMKTWERPLEPGYIRSPIMYDGKTSLIDYLGNEVLNEETSNFIIVANAAKYLADVSVSKGEVVDREKIINPIERKILFSGGLQIYRKGVIPGTDISGSDLVIRGKIWTAKKGDENLGLRHIIYGQKDREEDRNRAIKAIINGYELQERREEEVQSRLRHSEYMRGAMDNHEANFGTFGNTPFKL